MWGTKDFPAGNPKVPGRWPVRIALLLIVVVVAAIAWFNRLYYPAFGLKGLSKPSYQQALLQAGRGFASSESLSLVWSLSGNYREASPYKAYAWGTFRLQNSKGEEAVLWVLLKWEPFWQRWQRSDCSLLADPRDKLLFAENLLTVPHFTKLSCAIASIGREACRRLREVYRGVDPSS